jgi:hypothetical protein
VDEGSNPRHADYDFPARISVGLGSRGGMAFAASRERLE